MIYDFLNLLYVYFKKYSVLEFNFGLDKQNDYETVDLQIPYKYGKIIAQVQDGVEILERVYDDQGIKLKIRGNKNRLKKILKITPAL